LHPRENLHNYDSVINALQQNKRLSVQIMANDYINNWDLIQSSDLICGMSSMLLLESVLLGKPILSVQVGLKRANPFILARRALIKSITNQKQLSRSLKFLLAKNKKPHYNFKVIKNPIENIITLMERMI
jgi:predicted glycosyltransferase